MTRSTFEIHDQLQAGRWRPVAFTGRMAMRSPRALRHGSDGGWRARNGMEPRHRARDSTTFHRPDAPSRGNRVRVCRGGTTNHYVPGCSSPSRWIAGQGPGFWTPRRWPRPLGTRKARSRSKTSISISARQTSCPESGEGHRRDRPPAVRPPRDGPLCRGPYRQRRRFRGDLSLAPPGKGAASVGERA